MNNSFSDLEFDQESTSNNSFKYDLNGINNIYENYGIPFNKNNNLKENLCIKENKTKDFENNYKNIFKYDFSNKDFSEFNDNNSEEISNNNLENKDSILGKKTERNEIINYEKINKIKENDKDKIFGVKKDEKVEKEYIYRFDYYKMLFIGNFLEWVYDQINELIDNCSFCKKFGSTKFHKANRKLYAGNPKEEDNRNFIEKTIEEVFSSTEEQKNLNIGNKLQKDNENMIKKIYNYYDKLLIKKEKDEKYVKQFNSIEKFIKFIKIQIKDALDIYYDSKEFIDFKSDRRIIYYDKMFYFERNRKFSLLKKNHFVRLVNLPFYGNKKNNNKEEK